MKAIPSQSDLLEKFHYDEASGKLFWEIRLDGSHSSKCFNAQYAGEEAGHVTDRKYILINLGGIFYLAHRIIWKMKTGKDPGPSIDHIDRDTLNNRFANLRDVTISQNMWNTKMHRTNTSGYRGVSFRVVSGKWQARIRVGGKEKNLGLFSTPELAHAAFVAATALYRDEFASVA